MSQHPRSSRRLVAIGAAALALGALCVLLFQGRDHGQTGHQSTSAASTPASHQESGARDTGPARAGSDGAAESDEDPDDRPSRQEEYEKHFDRKLARYRERIARDCAGNEPFLHALDGFDEVKDRIIASAVATDRGLKTKAEQRQFEKEQIEGYDAKVCKDLAGLQAPPECKRHFRSCDNVL